MNRYRQGEHICVFYNRPAEQRAVAAEYLADGLRRHERVFYAAPSTDALEPFNAALRLLGVDVEAMLASAALVEATPAEAHLATGSFDSAHMIGFLKDAIDAALAAGFSGLRTCGDMSWLLENPPGADQVVEYEARLNEFFPEARVCGMCQYDITRLPAALIDHGLATHPTAIVNRVHKPNRFYQPEYLATSRIPRPGEAHLKLHELRRLDARLTIGE